MQGLERIREALRTQLFARVPAQYEQAYRRHCLTGNLRRMIAIALMSLAVQAMTIAFHLFADGGVVAEGPHIWAVIASSVYAVAMLCYLITNAGAAGGGREPGPASPYVFWAVFAAFELLVGGIEIAVYGTEFRAYATVLVLALVPLFPRRVILTYVGCFYIAISAILVFSGGPVAMPSAHFFYWAVFAVATVFFACMNCSGSALAFVSNQRLLESNETLAGLNESLRELNEELEEISMSDPLTQIANRRAFDDYFERTWAQAERAGSPVALFAIDIDHFAVFNAHFGQQEGDRCLQRVAAALASRLDSTASMLARYGGEEFVVLSAVVSDEAELLQLAESLRSAVESLKIPNPDSTNNPCVTISIGLAARVPGADIRPEGLVRLAMRALGDAKERGRNRAVADVSAERSAFVAPRESAIQAPGSGEDLIKLHTILTSTTMATFAVSMESGAFEFSPEILEYADMPSLRFDDMRAAVEALVFEEDREAVLRDVEKIESFVDDDIPCVFRMRMRDGALRWVSIISRYLPGEAGAPGEVVGSLTDVDVRMREQQISQLMADGAAGYLFHLELKTMRAWFNDSLREDMELDPGDLHASFLARLLKEDRGLIEGALADIRDGVIDTLDLEVRARRPDGQIVNLHCRGLANQDADGVADMLAGTISDITEQVKAQQINRLIIDGSSDCVYVYDIMDNTLEFSPKIMEMTRLPSLRFSNAIRVFLECIVPEDRDRFLTSLDPVFSAQTDEYAIEMRLIGPDDHPVWIAFRGKASFNENNEPTVIAGSIFNIERMGEYNSYLEQQSLTDRVTALPNRISFYREANRLMRDGVQDGFIVMLDIDDFKSVNNMHGHAVGDETLKRFGDMIMAEMIQGGTLFHLGADLFLVNLPGARREDAVRWMEHMCGVKAKFMIEGNEVFLTFSMGAVEYREQRSADELLSDAEIALHRAKYQSSDDYVVFEPDDRADYMHRLELETRLRRAVDDQFEGFELYYQPLVSARDSACVGAEALLRWHSPTGEIIPPIDTIAALEAVGLMPRVENWILRTAIAQCRRWLDAGAPADFIMNINLTPAQIARRALSDEVAALLHQYGLHPRNITLEITEASCLLDMQGGVNVLRRLRDQGLGIAVDDFGTGYSSLSYLRQLPVNEIKIDRSFVRDIETDRSGVSFMASIIQLARSIGHLVCVEGIETDRQRYIVRDLGADLFQGYFFSRPVPADDFSAKYIYPALPAVVEE